MTAPRKPRKKRYKHQAKTGSTAPQPTAGPPPPVAEPNAGAVLDELLVLARSSQERLGHLGGIREAAVAAMREREARVAQLVLLDTVLSQSEDLTTVRLVMGDVLRQAGLRRVSEPLDDRELFAVVPSPAPRSGVVTPAYVDEVTGRIVQRGTVEEQEEAS